MGYGHPVVYASAKIGEDQLVITGSFEQVGTTLAPHVALWNGKEWKAINQGLASSLDRLAATPSGELFGSVAYVTPDGDYLSKLYKWDKSSWTEVATFDGQVTDIDVDSSGTLYVAGAFSTIVTGAESQPVANVARFDGTRWSELKEAPANAAVVRAIDGKVYVGGPLADVAVQIYDGTTWTRLPFGEEAFGQVNALDVQDGRLVVGGRFRLNGASPGGSVARQNGSSWELVGGGVQASLGFGAYDIGDVRDVVVVGSKIYVTGLFVLAGDTSVANLAAFDTAPGTSSWSTVGGGITGNTGGAVLDTVPLGHTLTSAGGSLYVGGGFSVGGSRAAVGVARWDGTDWSALEDPKVERIGVNGDFVEVLAEGTGGAIYVGGAFDFTGRDVRTSKIARFENNAWAPLGSGFDGRVLSIVTDDTSVYAGGAFTQSGTVATPYVARWDGRAWSALGEALDGPVRTLVRGPDGKIYAGGAFARSGDTTLNSIGVWDGSRWSALGTGVDGPVGALAFDEAGRLYAGGMFSHAGGKEASAVALWDGTGWSALGQGLNGNVRSLVVYDGKVTAGGNFRLAEDAKDRPYTNLAAWDGSAWKAVGGGTHGPSDSPSTIGGVASLSERQGKLYVGGEFAEVGDGRGVPRSPVKFLAQWDGKSWSRVGDEPNDIVSPVLVTNEALWIGGGFTLIGQLRSNLIGRYVFGTP